MRAFQRAIPGLAVGIGFGLFVGEPAGAAGPALESGWPEHATFPRACDGSAAVSTSSGVLIASDESNTLSLFARTGGFLARGDLVGPIESSGHQLNRKQVRVREIDVEGAAATPDRIYWIGSHGLNKKGKQRENRQILFATGYPGASSDGVFELELVGSPVSLLDGLLALPDGKGERIREVIEAKVPPKAGGLNIEGLGLGPGGELLIGLRSPLFPAQAGGNPEALVVRLKDPSKVVAGQDFVLAADLVPLGNRGVRSLAWSKERSAWIMLAGRVDTKADFALFSWRGKETRPELLAEALPGNPEAMIVEADGVFVFSDDGTQKVELDGANLECKEHLEIHAVANASKSFSDRDPLPEALAFRGRWVPLPAH